MKFFEKKKLTKLVLAWMLCTGVGVVAMPQAEAESGATSVQSQSTDRTVESTTTDTNDAAIGENSAFFGNLRHRVGTTEYEALHTSQELSSYYFNVDATGYTTTMNSGQLKNLYGGYTDKANTAAANNKVILSGGTVGSVYGGWSINGNATGNTVTISGGTAQTVCGGVSGNGNASNNTVTISDNANLLATTMIYGGLAMNGEASNNTVNILTAINVRHIEGGAPSTGNTLNIAAKGVTVGDDGVVGFQNMNFYLPSNIASGDTMLTVNAKDLEGNGVATDLTGVAIGAAVQAGAKLKNGDTVNLITNPSGLTTDGTTTMKQITDKKVTIQTKPTAITLTTDQSYKLDISKKGENTIIATVSGVEEKQNEERTAASKSLVETRAAGAAFINAGADLLISAGFPSAKDAATGAVLSGFTPFVSVGGSGMRTISGSHVDTRGIGMLVGVAKQFNNKQGSLVFGPFIEYGGGDYESYLDDGTKGDGGTHCWGGGLMARQENHDGLYYEASLRVGKVKSDYNGNLDGIGAIHYDSSSPYLGAHLGLGKIFDIGHNNTLNGYVRYLYSRQGSDDVTIRAQGLADQPGHFDSMNSSRIRVGARLTHKVNDTNTIYGGLAYQYEFSGEARATFNGTSVPSPSIKGSSGLMEIGWQVKPTKSKDLTLDLSATGWAGKQRGIVGQLSASWKF